jgi:ankyrin repeat protein
MEQDAALFDAIKDNKVETVEQLITSKANVNASDAIYFSFTPLHWAAYKGDASSDVMMACMATQ